MGLSSERQLNFSTVGNSPFFDVFFFLHFGQAIVKNNQSKLFDAFFMIDIFSFTKLSYQLKKKLNYNSTNFELFHRQQTTYSCGVQKSFGHNW